MHTDSSRLSAKERSRIAIAAAQERSRLKKLTEPTAKPVVIPTAALEPSFPSNASTHPAKAPESPARPLAEALPSSVELWVEIVDRADRDVFGWVYIADRKIDRKALGIVLNSHHWLSKLALSGAEPKALSWVFANLLVEALISGQKQRPWKRAVVDYLRSRVFTPAEEKSFSRLWFTEKLSATPIFAGIPELIAESDGPRKKLFTLRLE
jgi:hypothetical protein